MASTLWQVTVCDALDAMRKDGTLCDTTIVGFDGVVLYAHACVLTAASPGIATYVKRTNDGRYYVNIDWISGPSWDLLLRLLYRGAIDVDRDDEIDHVRALAESLDISTLVTTVHPHVKVEMTKRGRFGQGTECVDTRGNSDVTLDHEKEQLAFEMFGCEYSPQDGATRHTEEDRLSSAAITKISHRADANDFRCNGHTPDCVYNLPANFALDFSKATLQGIHESTKVNHFAYQPVNADNNVAAHSNLATCCTAQIMYHRTVPTLASEYEFVQCQDSSITMTYTGADKRHEIRTCSPSADVNLTSHVVEHVAPPTHYAVANTCNVATDVGQYPTHIVSKAVELLHTLGAVDAQKETVASGTVESEHSPVVADTGSTPLAHAPVNPPGSSLPLVKGSTSQKVTHKYRSKKWSCDKCEKTFSSSSGMSKHALLHTGKRPFSCSVCGMQFSRHGNMMRHHRTHTEVKPYKCSVCHKEFGQKVLLTRHHIIHTGARPYSCDICGLTFSWKTSLTSHRLTHSGNKPHACAQCGSAFRMAYGLRRHMTMHTGERSHVCNVCGLAFSQNSNLASHRKTHTNVRPHRCPDCGSSFVRKYHLRRHLQIHKKQHGDDRVCTERHV